MANNQQLFCCEVFRNRGPLAVPPIFAGTCHGDHSIRNMLVCVCNHSLYDELYAAI